MNKKTGYEVPIHVDAASGGFIAPFLQPDIEWDFRLPLVKSINSSGHKYGLVYPGVGWVVWRDKDQLPEDLIFHCNYLGGDLPNFALNFSRPGNKVIAQYYNFIRLGREGYFQIQKNCQDIALYLSNQIAEMGPFELISDGSDIPVFAFSVRGAGTGDAKFSAYDLSDKIRERGWLIPAYTFPKNREDLAALRIVVKEGFSRDMADLLIKDLHHVVAYYESQPTHIPKKAGHTVSGAAFHH